MLPKHWSGRRRCEVKEVVLFLAGVDVVLGIVLIDPHMGVECFCRHHGAPELPPIGLRFFMPLIFELDFMKVVHFLKRGLQPKEVG